MAWALGSSHFKHVTGVFYFYVPQNFHFQCKIRNDIKIANNQIFSNTSDALYTGEKNYAWSWAWCCIPVILAFRSRGRKIDRGLKLSRTT